MTTADINNEDKTSRSDVYVRCGRRMDLMTRR